MFNFCNRITRVYIHGWRIRRSRLKAKLLFRYRRQDIFIWTEKKESENTRLEVGLLFLCHQGTLFSMDGEGEREILSEVGLLFSCHQERNFYGRRGRLDFCSRVAKTFFSK